MGDVPSAFHSAAQVQLRQRDRRMRVRVLQNVRPQQEEDPEVEEEEDLEEEDVKIIQIYPL